MYQFPMRGLCFQVLMCSDLAEVAGNIRGISEQCMTSNRERPSGDWLARQWFTEVSQVTYMTVQFFSMIERLNTVKPVLSGHNKTKQRF